MEPTLDVPREYTIQRSTHFGYGFVAGSETPSIVKFIQPNGPSHQRLLQGDIITAVNGINVSNVPGKEIINMIQLSKDQITIQVVQPTNLVEANLSALNRSNNVHPLAQLNDRSRFMQQTLPTNTTNAPMDRLVTSISHQQQYYKSSTHLADEKGDQHLPNGNSNGTSRSKTDRDYSKTLDRNGTANYGSYSPPLQRCKSSASGALNGSPSKKTSANQKDDLPMLKRRNTMQIMKIMKTMTRVFLENETQSRVFNYDEKTTVGTILEVLHDRLIQKSPYSDQIKSYFGLVLTFGPSENIDQEQEPKRNTFFVLEASNQISKIANLYYSHQLRFIYRMVKIPKELSALYAQDKIAFDYLYKQSCNDLRFERFGPEMDHDTTLKLLAISLVEHVLTKHNKNFNKTKNPKVYIKLIKDTPGIEHYFPTSMVERKRDKKDTQTFIICNRKKLKARLIEQLRKNFEEFDFEPPTTKTMTGLDRYHSTSFHELSLPGMHSSPDFFIKLMFLNYLGQLPCYAEFYKKMSNRASSPVERSSVGDYSSSLESMARASDSSPLIKQDRNQQNQVNTNINNQNQTQPTQSVQPYHNETNTMPRLAQINSHRPVGSMRSVNSVNPIDQHDSFLAQTPSTESISSITFNSQTSPSPQLAGYTSHHSDSLYPVASICSNPSPMPRNKNVISRPLDHNGNYKCSPYSKSTKSIEEEMFFIPPPPPPTRTMMDNHFNLQNYLTPLLTDLDINELKVPPPPLFNS